MDLTQAEAINDMITAEDYHASSLAMRGIRGSVSRLVNPFIQKLLDIIANIEVNIDYPEYEDVEQLTQETVLPLAHSLKGRMDEILKKEGCRVKTVHPFFIPKDDNVQEINGIEIKKYNQEEILQFKDDDRFDEAFCFSEESPDVLAVAAIIDDEIVGMAGASADSPSFWQIGINVNKNFEGRHIASGLVSILKADILKKGIVPYYGTSFSNLASQHVAAKAGFEVAWVELITERMES